MIFDHSGLIASIAEDGTIDGGDSLAEESRIRFLLELNKNLFGYQPEPNILGFESMLSVLDQRGLWIRNPSKWNDPKDISRDQLDPMNCLLGLLGRQELLDINKTKLIKNFFRFPNGDISSPEHFVHLVRHHKPWLRYLGDLFMLLNSIIIVFTSFFDKEGKLVRNDLNHMISLLHAEWFYPTRISRWAAVLYIAFRKNHKDKHTPGWFYALVTYYPAITGNEDIVYFYLKPMQWLTTRS